ncbi:hypothetical protein DYBT9623_00735 [Dyadobacter sp. CECT 9623]|uniref:Uncharacterized protein n=1 Tax=Dyadobacter linearis TaxID=2823330 RepID=A0ABN7R8E6_9BACT|nr:hypothetical protein [Dyadobacter sp. CECT 9623]CAG5068007.1 hypothetical protein DYBT9623_00735 [Dyadobacter sp. CECT 9623]
MITLIINKEGNMATQTTKKQGVEKKVVFASGYTHAKPAHQVSYTKPFVMPDLFLEQAEDMGHFLDKNPLPLKD